MKNIVNIMNAISSGNYTLLLIECAYGFVDVSLVSEVKAGHLNWEPDEHAYNECDDYYDVEVEHPQFVYDCSEYDCQVQYVEKKVIIEEHLE